MPACSTSRLLAVLRPSTALWAQAGGAGERPTTLSRAQQALAVEMVSAHEGNLVRLPMICARARGEVERRTGLSWRGPDPLVVLAGQFPPHDPRWFPRAILAVR
jgi:hypothetical protein